MNQLLKSSIAKGISYEEYNNQVQHFSLEGKASGTKQSIERIEFTKLNASRMRRIGKKTTLTDESLAIFKNTPKQTWLVITESWCGDAAQTLPVLNNIASSSENIDLKIVYRDENSDLMSSFLTNGAQAIPKLIIVDEEYNLINIWGPRSKNATKLVADYKQEYGAIDAEFKKQLQIWYNKDKGMSIIKDLVKLIKGVNAYSI